MIEISCCVRSGASQEPRDRRLGGGVQLRYLSIARILVLAPSKSGGWIGGRCESTNTVKKSPVHTSAKITSTTVPVPTRHRWNRRRRRLVTIPLAQGSEEWVTLQGWVGG
jgi:hypothetical protein